MKLGGGGRLIERNLIKILKFEIGAYQIGGLTGLSKIADWRENHNLCQVTVK